MLIACIFTSLQVDFTVEARNMVRFATNFRKEIKNGTLKFPIVSQSMLR